MPLTKEEEKEITQFEVDETDTFAQFERETSQKPYLTHFKSNPKIPIILIILHVINWYNMIYFSCYAEYMCIFISLFISMYLADLASGLAHLHFDYIEIPMKPLSDPARRTPFAYGSWGFQQHHATPKYWRTVDLYYYAISKTGFFFLCSCWNIIGNCWYNTPT